MARDAKTALRVETSIRAHLSLSRHVRPGSRPHPPADGVAADPRGSSVRLAW